ncbi:MAG: DUF559 domain-containing protein [Chloroflexota bacterium]
MTHTDKRLIEEFIPIKQISAEASREKSIRHGHISTLHLWWARRPLVASRAAVFAALVPADARPQVKERASDPEPMSLNKFMIELCKWNVAPEIIEEARRLIREAYPDAPPKVLDMFAGGGAIPLEALRLGCEAYALDLNPVAHIIELATLVYPQKYGPRLAEDVRTWGEWVLERVRAEVGDLYPLIPDPEFTPEKAEQKARLSGDQMALPWTPHPQPLSLPGERGAGPHLSEGRRGEKEGGERIEISPELERRMTDVARQLRQEATPSEDVLWQALRNRQLDGFKFRRQQPIGPFVLDFFCAEARLAVEVDGPIHETQREADTMRQEMLESVGIHFIRVVANDVMNSLDTVLSQIRAALLPPPSEAFSPLSDAFSPLPDEGEGPGVRGEDEPDNTTAGVPFGYLQPVAYLWTRTVTCPNPACRATVPLVRQTWLKKKKGDNVALEMKPHPTENRMAFHVRHARDPQDFGFDPAGFSQRGNSVCGRCGTTVTNDTVKAEGKAGRMGAQMMATVCVRPGARGKVYLSPDDLPLPVPDEDAIRARIAALTAETGITPPDEEIGGSTRDFFTPLYGLTRYSDLFTPRQMLTLLTFVKHVRSAHDAMLAAGLDGEYAKGITTYLGIILSRFTNFYSSECVWYSDGGRGVRQVFIRQALPMTWDYAESNPYNPAASSWHASTRSVLDALSPIDLSTTPGQVLRASATNTPVANTHFDAVVTDPPYYDNVSYSDLSDYFYVWLSRAIGFLHSEHFSTELAPKKNEAISVKHRHGNNQQRAREFYETMMQDAFSEAHRVLDPGGIMVTVYAHKTTAGWSTLIEATRKAGFCITEAWPLETEQAHRALSQDTAALASSIFLVGRKRDNGNTARYVEEVQPEMKRIVKERVGFLLAYGIAGADLSIATVGAALAPFTRYARVELPNGEELTAAAYLEEVQREVIQVLLGEAAKSDERTQYYLMARNNYGGARVEFDEANNLARTIGVELDSGPDALTRGADALVEKKGSQVRLLTFEERGDSESLGLPTAERPKASLIDVLHRLLWLVEHDNAAIQDFLAQTMPDKYMLRVVAQTLQGKALASEPKPGAMLDERTPEQRAIQTLLASWRRIMHEDTML